MNRNHQGRNDQKRTNQGRHHVAYEQMHRFRAQRPQFDSYSRQHSNYRPYEERLKEKMQGYKTPEWESLINRPFNERKARHIDTGFIDEWDNEDEPMSTSDNYEEFHRTGEPIPILPREKYRHVSLQNTTPNFHDRDLSYRARSERHPERFVGETSFETSGEDISNISYAGLGPKGYRRSDSSLEEEVCELLTQDPYIDASEIFVAVEEGVVKLSGLVDDREEKFEIERSVDGIWGVEDIINDIKVKRRTMIKTRH